MSVLVFVCTALIDSIWILVSSARKYMKDSNRIPQSFFWLTAIMCLLAVLPFRLHLWGFEEIGWYAELLCVQVRYFLQRSVQFDNVHILTGMDKHAGFSLLERGLWKNSPFCYSDAWRTSHMYVV